MSMGTMHLTAPPTAMQGHRQRASGTRHGGSSEPDGLCTVSLDRFQECHGHTWTTAHGNMVPGDCRDTLSADALGFLTPQSSDAVLRHWCRAGFYAHEYEVLLHTLQRKHGWQSRFYAIVEASSWAV